MKKSEKVNLIIEYLNNKANKKYRPNIPKTVKLIELRLNEGFIIKDFMEVIDKKVKQWKNNPEMNKYIRPETLFGTKFESYLNETNDIEIESRYKEFDPDVYK